MAFLPLYLAKELGYNPWWIGLCMFMLQAAGFARTQAWTDERGWFAVFWAAA